MWSSKDAGCVHVLAEIANFGCEWFFKVLFMGELTGCKRFGCVLLYLVVFLLAYLNRFVACHGCSS
jgi:hypothetical protein